MLQLPVTSVTSALAAIMLVTLSVPVTFRRIRVGTAIGDADDEVLRRRVRAQGNFIEYVPLGLVLLGLAEAAGAARAVLVLMALALGCGRLAHAYGMLNGQTPVRAAGMMLTYIALLTGAASVLLRLA